MIDNNELLRRVVVADVTVSALLTFLEKLDLEEKAKEYVKEYLQSVTKEQWREVIVNVKKSCENEEKGA